jgi:hypothetical protein
MHWHSGENIEYWSNITTILGGWVRENRYDGDVKKVSPCLPEWEANRNI